eukprot:gene2694-5306_t
METRATGKDKATDNKRRCAEKDIAKDCKGGKSTAMSLDDSRLVHAGIGMAVRNGATTKPKPRSGSQYVHTSADKHACISEHKYRQPYLDILEEVLEPDQVHVHSQLVWDNSIL